MIERVTRMNASLLFTLLLLAEILHFSLGDGGCGFCQDGTLSSPETAIALAAPEQVHSCSDWQQISALTEDFNDASCKFIRPFYDAICGCSSLSSVHERCDLCGSPEMAFGNPSKGLLIPNSNSQLILCSTVYAGVKMGGVPADDCQTLRGINDYCGGCVPETGDDEEAPILSVVPTNAPTITATIATEEPTRIEVFTTMIKSFAPSSAPIAVASSAPSSATTTVEPSNAPTVTSSSAPSSAPTTVEPSNAPTVTSSSAPSSAPTTVEPSNAPTVTSSSAPSLPVTTAMTTEPSSAPSGVPTIEQFVTQPVTATTCDLCPSTDILGTLSTPDKLVTIVNMNNRTVTKTCGAYLWDARSGRDDIDAEACYFLLPFFGALCGCSTFSQPTGDDADQIDARLEVDISKTNDCQICEDPNHVFQTPFTALPIPGSDATKITCGGLFSASMNGAVTSEDCELISTISDVCGGCGPKPPRANAEPTPPKQCIGCLDDKDSSVYIYKDFGSSGTTFHKASSAPLHCNSRRRYEMRENIQPTKSEKCGRLLHPELEGCVLAPITSFEELLLIQSVIPPGKAAFTAVHKDGLLIGTDAKQCYNNVNSFVSQKRRYEVSANGLVGHISNENCRVENWLDGLKFGDDDHDHQSYKKPTNAKSTSHEALDACDMMKVGWTNYNAGTSVPTSLWNNGQPSYCNLGPVQEAGAVWAVEADGQNYGDLRDVSMHWPLPGAVYKCCKRIYSCFENTD